MSSIEFPIYNQENDCPVDYCAKIVDIAMKNSEVSCVFAREGSLQFEKILLDIQNKNALADDYELLKDLLETITKNTRCEYMKEATEIFLEILVDYEDDFDKHLKRGICKNLVCSGMYNIYIDPATCGGCSKCKEVCPSILGGNGMIHIILDNDEINNQKQKLIEVCPNNAIKKYGQKKPSTPNEPVPVGTFSGESDEGGGRRRKKRRG